MKTKLGECVSKVIINVAVQTAKMPNQSCAIMFGEAQSDLALKTSDYKNFIKFMNDKNQ